MNETTNEKLKSLGELALIFPGYSPRPDERKPNGKYLLLGGRNIKDGKLAKTEKDSYIDELSKNSFLRAIAQPGDIIVSTLFDRRKLYIYNEGDPQSVVNNSCAIIRAPDKNDYIISYLRTLHGQEKFLNDATESTNKAFIPRLTIKSISSIKVPLLPLAELQKLGDEHIRLASTDDLVLLQNELKSKDDLIVNLEDEITNLQGNEKVVEKLRTELEHITSYYEDRIQKISSQIETNDLMSVIAHGETTKIEFKSSLRWNLKADRDDKRMEFAVLKTIAAFCNTRGGELLIGVADDQSIIGIDHDHFSNDDNFLLHLRNLITDKIIPGIAQYVNFDLVSLGDKKIPISCICQNAEGPIPGYS